MMIFIQIKTQHIEDHIKRKEPNYAAAEPSNAWTQLEDCFAEEPSIGMTLDLAAAKLSDEIDQWDIESASDVRALSVDLEDGTSRDVTEEVLRHAFHTWFESSEYGADMPSIFDDISGNYARAEISDAGKPGDWAREHSTH